MNKGMTQRENHAQVLGGARLIACCLHFPQICVSGSYDSCSKVRLPIDAVVIFRAVCVLPGVEMPFLDCCETSITGFVRFRIQPPGKAFVKNWDVAYILPKIVDEGRIQPKKVRATERVRCCPEDRFLEEVGKIGDLYPVVFDNLIFGNLAP